MSSVRAGTCAEPGPWDYHCTEAPGHRYSCYDAGEDTSWNDRSPEGWQEETPHACSDPHCRSDRAFVEPTWQVKFADAIRAWAAGIRREAAP